MRDSCVSELRGLKGDGWPLAGWLFHDTPSGDDVLVVVRVRVPSATGNRRRCEGAGVSGHAASGCDERCAPPRAVSSANGRVIG